MEVGNNQDPLLALFEQQGRLVSNRLDSDVSAQGKTLPTWCGLLSLMKTYSRPYSPTWKGKDSPEAIHETNVLNEVCKDLRQTGTLTDQMKAVLTKTFQKRSDQAQLLVEGGKVSRFRFNPSGRTIWTVAGRKGEYQVLPESMFCTCDDYYFRVMGRKKQLCYHLIAQQLAEATGRHRSDSLRDADYEVVTARWKPAGTDRT